MTDLPAIARDNAVHCEARKIAYRQTKDGIVVSFVIHPNEVPDAVALADLGSRWMLAMVGIADDETPKQKEVMQNSGVPEHGNSTSQNETRPRADADNASRGAKKLTTRIAILCQDPVFQQFLLEQFDIEKSEIAAAEFVRDKCRVASRKDIAGTDAEALWLELHREFQGWNYGTHCGAA